MKKTLLAAALIVGFAGVAQAETSVTMYGILDTGYGYSQFKNTQNGQDYKRVSSGLTSGTFNGNRWGVKGAEDLGTGLRAIFTLETGFDIGTGMHQQGGAFVGRQAFVGLSSDNWGTFTMGRQYNVAAGFTYANNMSVNMGDMDKTFGAQGLNNRMNNSFKYVTPSFSGFQAGAAYGNANTAVTRNGNTVGDTQRSQWLSTGLQYANGPILVAANYDRANNSYSSPVSNWALSGSYNFEIVKLALAYGQDRHGKLGWGGPLGGQNGTGVADTVIPVFNLDGATGNFRSNNYYVALSAPVAGGTLVGSWSRSSSNLNNEDSAYGGVAKAQNIYQVNYNYPLSKRTSLYAYGSYGTGINYIDNLKGQEAGVGINHKF